MQAQRPAAALMVVLLAASLSAQQPEFKAGVELVTVPVTVTSRDRNTYIADLTSADFELEENGKKQVVTTLTRERRPLSLCLVVDSSGSMALGNRRELATDTVQRLVAGLEPEDEVAIVFFADTIEMQLPWTRVKEISNIDWRSWRPYGNSPLNDGMRLGLQLIERANNPRRGIVLVTDGFENASRESTASIVKTRRQSETTVYGIGVGSANIADLAADSQRVRAHLPPANADNLRKLEGEMPGGGGVRAPTPLPYFDYLETLVGDSGGTVNRVLSAPEAIMAVNNIVNELKYEYLVGFTPTQALDGKYRRLKVRVNRRGVYVRHREGYLALPYAQQP